MRGALVLTMVLAWLAGCGDGGDGVPEATPDMAADCADPPGGCPTSEVTLSDCRMPLANYRVPTGQSGVPAEWEPLGALPGTATVFLQSFFCGEGRLGDTSLGPVFFAVVGGDSANAPEPPESTANFGFWGYGIVAFTDNGALLDYLQGHGMTAEKATGQFAGSAQETVTIEGTGWRIGAECGNAQGPDGHAVVEMFLYHGARADPILLDVLYEGGLSRVEAGAVMAQGGVVGAQLGPAGATASTCGNQQADAVLRFLDWPE